VIRFLTQSKPNESLRNMSGLEYTHEARSIFRWCFRFWAIGLAAMAWAALLLVTCASGAAEEPATSTTRLQPREVRCPTSEDLQRWFKPLDKIGLQVAPPDGPVPIDCSAELFSATGADTPAERRGNPPAVVHWVPTELAHQPLYFDDVPLERYGQSVCPVAQPLLSGAHFFGMFPLIPYKMGIDRTHDPVYTLGYYRPGSPTPCVRQKLPWEKDAALMEAGTWVGLLLLIP